MWQFRRRNRNRYRYSVGRNSENLTAEDFDARYAAMSTDPAYTAPLMKMTSASHKRNQATNEQEVFHLLGHLHFTAEGNDGLPAWLLRLVALCMLRRSLY